MNSRREHAVGPTRVDATRPRRPRLVRRDRLLHDLTATADDVPLVLVTAPAGYGKTIVLRQWAAEDQRPFAWVHLEPADSDPVRLLRHIALALHRIRPLNYSVWRALSSLRESDVGVVLARLIATTTAAGSPWVLILDDMHLLPPDLGSDVVTAFVNGLPPGCHVVVSGRHQPGVRLGGLRSQGRCVEFGPAELALGPDEAAAVVATAGIHLSDRSAADLLRRTEGWPTGVYLTARSLQDGADAHVFTGGVSPTVDYLCEEVLYREPPEIVRFLLRTAPLDRLSGPLCDAVLESTDAAARLADLRARNVFLLPQDADGLWYRYHPMFAETLLTELRRLEPAEEARAHRRAALWYEAHGHTERAVRHALAGRDTATAARLIARYGQRWMTADSVATVRGWLGGLDGGAIADHPPLAVVAGWVWALSGNAARAQDCLHAAEQGVASGIPAAGSTPDDEAALPSGIARLRAALAPAGVERMRADAVRALDLEPPGGTCRPVSELLLGVAHVLNGDPDAAVGALERAAHFGRERRRTVASLALAQLALLCADQDDWPAAESYVAEAADLVEPGNRTSYPATITVYVAQARVAVHRRDTHLARQYAGKALRAYADAAPVAFPWLAAQLAIALGRVLLDLDDEPAARLKVTEARRHLARLSADGVLGGRHRLLAKDLARRGERPRRASAMTLTTAELRVLRLLPTHLTLSEIADALFLSRNTVKTQVSSIYGKLLASTRAEAVRSARGLGLVE